MTRRREQKISPIQLDLIRQIAQRAVRLYQDVLGEDIPQWEFEAEISMAHASNPLRLGELLEANDGNFAHDIGGIRNNLNRLTGELRNCFSPRYSA